MVKGLATIAVDASQRIAHPKLVDLWNRMFSELAVVSPTMCEIHKGYLRASSESVASFCAGTECPKLVMEALAETDGVTSYAGQVNVSAEIDTAKRDLLMLLHDDGSHKMFGDIHDFLQQKALNYRTNAKVAVPVDNDGLVAGFPCKDFSSLQHDATKKLSESEQNAIERKSNKSGVVFHALMKYIRKCKHKGKPLDWLILENVKGILATPRKKRGGKGGTAATAGGRSRALKASLEKKREPMATTSASATMTTASAPTTTTSASASAPVTPPTTTTSAPATTTSASATVPAQPPTATETIIPATEPPSKRPLEPANDTVNATTAPSAKRSKRHRICTKTSSIAHSPTVLGDAGSAADNVDTTSAAASASQNGRKNNKASRFNRRG